MANPAIIVDFIANTDKLAAGFRSAGSQTQGFGSKLKGMGKAAVVAGRAAGLAALTGTLKIGIDEMTEASKVSAQTAAAIKSTGGAAGVSARHVEKMAGALMKKSGVDDEAIQSGENLLLTFTNVRNETGKGNKIFDEATKTMLDMSTALGTDAKTSAMQLGKALNDPVKGITALQRVGVTFTAAQKEQIKQMVKSGDTMGAQKKILGELNKEFGGSAEAAGKTLPGQINILKESFSNLAGELVTALVPALTAIAGFFAKNPGLAKVMVLGILAVSAAMVGLNVALAISAALASPWILIAVGIAAAAALLAGGLVYAYKHSETFAAIVDGAFNTVKAVAETLFGFFKSNWPLLLGILTGPIGLAAGLIIKYWDTIKGATQSAWTWIKNATTGTWTAIRNFISGALTSIAGLVTGAWSAVRSATSGAWGGVKSLIDGAISAIKSVITALGTWVSGWASGTWAAITSRIGASFNAVKSGADAAVAAVRNAMNGIVSAVEAVIGRVRNAAESVANAIRAPINHVVDMWNGLSIPRVSITIPSVKIGKKKIGGGNFGFGPFAFPDMPHLAKGGIVTSPTLALVGEAGPEAVIPLDKMPAPSVQVRVFIGDQELTSLVRTEISTANTGLARALLAG